MRVVDKQLHSSRIHGLAVMVIHLKKVGGPHCGYYLVRENYKHL